MWKALLVFKPSTFEPFPHPLGYTHSFQPSTSAQVRHPVDRLQCPAQHGMHQGQPLQVLLAICSVCARAYEYMS